MHGDERGSVDDEHNRVGSAYLARDDQRLSRESSYRKHDAITLSDEMRAIVRDAVIEHCTFRGVRMLALSVRTNHVHLVVTPGLELPGALVGRFKAWATRRLREHGYLGVDARVWTSRASTRYLFFEEAVFGAIRYVLEEQGVPDRFTVDGWLLERPGER
jgi:REP element-mobilizing transposase RayT